MKTIKIGWDTVEVKIGDYIEYNGRLHIFVSGDGRILKRKDNISYKYLIITDKALAKVPLETMKQEVLNKPGMNIMRFYF